MLCNVESYSNSIVYTCRALYDSQLSFQLNFPLHMAAPGVPPATHSLDPPLTLHPPTHCSPADSSSSSPLACSHSAHSHSHSHCSAFFPFQVFSTTAPDPPPRDTPGNPLTICPPHFPLPRWMHPESLLPDSGELLQVARRVDGRRCCCRWMFVVCGWHFCGWIAWRDCLAGRPLGDQGI